MAPGGLRGTLGRQLGSRSLPGRLPRRSRRPPGLKTINCYLPRLRRNFPVRFQPPRGSRGALWAPCWEPLGLFLALRLATGVQNGKISFFANSPHENLDFQGSGGLPGGIFGTKNRSKNKLEAKTARTHTPGASKSLPERSWRASGAPQKNFVLHGG